MSKRYRFPNLLSLKISFKHHTSTTIRTVVVIRTPLSCEATSPEKHIQSILFKIITLSPSSPLPEIPVTLLLFFSLWHLLTTREVYLSFGVHSYYQGPMVNTRTFWSEGYIPYLGTDNRYTVHTYQKLRAMHLKCVHSTVYRLYFKKVLLALKIESQK